MTAPTPPPVPVPAPAPEPPAFVEPAPLPVPGEATLFAIDTDVVGALANISTAAIALAALLVAAFAARAAIETNRAQQRTLELQRQQFEATEARIEREQASNVTLTIDIDTKSDRDRGDWYYLLASITNSSPNPIDYVVFFEPTPEIRVLGSTSTVQPTGSEPKVIRLPVPITKGVTKFEVYAFSRDSAGVQWIRGNPASCGSRDFRR